MSTGYAELHCRSHFSFLTGASSPEELVVAAHRQGYAALAITDECSLAGVVRAHAAARPEPDQPALLSLIIGSEMRLSLPPAAANRRTGAVAGEGSSEVTGAMAGMAAGPATPRRKTRQARQTLSAIPPSAIPPLPASSPLAGLSAAPRLVLLAQTRRGYGNLSTWISIARRRAPKGQYLAYASDLEGQVPNAPYLAGLPDCFALLIPEPGQDTATLLAHAQWLKTWFGSERAAIAIELLQRPGEARLLELLPQVAELAGLPLVAAGDVLMHRRSRKPLADVLAATRLNRTVADGGFALAANAQAHLRALPQLARLYAPAWLEASLRIAASCRFSLSELRYEYPEEIVPPGHTPASWLRALTEAGAAQRFPNGLPDKVRQSIEHELQVIAQLRFEPYFLTVADIVAWARGQNILCQGRGSAANSTVCYCLGVTEVDPDRTQLLFERFISPERNEPPDIDLDFEHQRREEVMQYLYAKYGRHRAALTAVVISYRPRSALRDVGRALGLDLDRITAVSKSQQWFDGRRIDPERLREHGFDPEAPLCRQWMALTEQLIGMPRHLSQHPGGFVIARDDVSRLVPVENAAMDGRTVIQWDKDDLDTLGLLKVDILALGMLSAIRRSLAWVAAKAGWPEARMQQVPGHDDAVYDMLCRADAIGLFQVESRAQLSMLPRLRPRRFYDLVIEVAIVRPGPIQGGMVHPYLRRRSGQEPVDYPSDEVRQVLERTAGVPIFQEQVMQLAMAAADFTPGEADRLRRAMAAWKRKGGLEPFHDRLVGRMVQKGYPPDYAERIFKQIQGFGEYGFPESHAASFALLVWVSAWLKHHHADAFLVGLLNSQPMGFYAPAQLVRDARAHGVQVLPVDVAHSDWDCALQDTAPPTVHPGPLPAWLPDGQALGLRPVRLGLRLLRGLREDHAQRLLAARSQAPFASVEDLARRASLDAQAMACLAEGDALRSLSGHRHQAAWAVRGLDTRMHQAGHGAPLLAESRTHEDPVELAAPALGEQVIADYQALGLSLKAHPLSLLRKTLDTYRIQDAATLSAQARPGQLVRASGLVTHRQRPETAKGVIFVTLEDETGAVNIIVWPQVAHSQRRPLLAARLLTVYGIWQSQGAVQHLVARRLVDHSELLQGLVVRSRDFH